MLLDRWRQMQRFCSTHLDSFSFFFFSCSKWMWLFKWSLSFLVPLSGVNTKSFLLHGLFEAKQVSICFNFFCRAWSAFQLQWDKITWTCHCSSLSGLLILSTLGAKASVTFMFPFLWRLPCACVSAKVHTGTVSPPLEKQPSSPER